MENLAILIGNAEYENLGSLDCCRADLDAVKELLEATGKFANISVLFNHDSSQLKDSLRTLIDSHEYINEIFFYFTGHGYQHEADFFFCATNFDAKRPHETGLSNTELHSLLRSADAELVIKVIDACSSGTLLLKSDGVFLPNDQKGFKDLIQIASCLDSQSSLTGDPLSLFTEKFRSAALRKTEGVVYYADIIAALRDEFIGNNYQTPHFISQGTGREQFVENAKRLDVVRKRLTTEALDTENTAAPSLIVEEEPNTLAVLEEAQGKFATQDLAETFIDRLFEKLGEMASSHGRLGQLFDLEIFTHADFEEQTSKAFIAKVLSGEKRLDNFVTATGQNSWQLAAVALMWPKTEEAENYILRLNCQLSKVQTKLALTPKLFPLSEFVLVVSCAPSLETCYVFEKITQHPLIDWNSYDPQGSEVIRRWYKMGWTDEPDSLAQKILDKLDEVVQAAVEAAEERLSKQK